MKTTLKNNNNISRYADEVRSAHSAKFPKTDCNYHGATIADFNGHCASRGTCAPSFRSISAEYFKEEAPKSFVAEAAFFVMIILTAAVPLVSSAYAMADLVRAFSL